MHKSWFLNVSYMQYKIQPKKTVLRYIFCICLCLSQCFTEATPCIIVRTFQTHNHHIFRVLKDMSVTSFKKTFPRKTHLLSLETLVS